MKKGFTLIELLVVIAIIALLSTLSVVALNSARAKARDARRLSDIKQIRTALEMYFDQNMAYPANPSVTTTLGLTNSICLTSNGWTTTAGCSSGILYMQNVPDDPQGVGTSIYKYTVGGGAGSTYTINYVLENGGAKTATQSSME
jgi:prepilin-type N-terminal cleavage/methylation domain-containing protein